VLHETFLQDEGPEQLTAQGPAPHCTFWQDSFEAQVMLHDAPCVQLMPLRHELSELHWMSHL